MVRAYCDVAIMPAINLELAEEFSVLVQPVRYVTQVNTYFVIFMHYITETFCLPSHWPRLLIFYAAAYPQVSVFMDKFEQEVYMYGLIDFLM
jgi:hypothetical protein